MFVIFINDLDQILSSDVTSKLFADDAKLYTVIETKENIDNLQENIDKLCAWANDWQLNIAIEKCNIIDFSTTDKDIRFENAINGKSLPRVNEVKDLGVLFDSRLRFSGHIAQMVTKAKQRLFLLFRAFRIREKKPLLRAYKSYILPLLNHCSSVWSPSLLGDIKKIESVQRL